jgi:hypothetical protein
MQIQIQPGVVIDSLVKRPVSVTVQIDWGLKGLIPLT